MTANHKTIAFVLLECTTGQSRLTNLNFVMYMPAHYMLSHALRQRTESEKMRGAGKGRREGGEGEMGAGRRVA